MGRRAFQTEGPVSSNLTGKESVVPPATCWRSEVGVLLSVAGEVAHHCLGSQRGKLVVRGETREVNRS